MSKTYRVGGMTCGGCASSVTRALERAAPGCTVKVDLGAGLVPVAGEVTPEPVARAVGGAGFTFGGIADRG